MDTSPSAAAPSRRAFSYRGYRFFWLAMMLTSFAAQIVAVLVLQPEGEAGRYLASLLAHPDVRAWEAAALAETTVHDFDEPRVIYRDKLAAAGR